VLKSDNDGGAPLLNVFGGKITTYRRLAEAALARIESEIGRRGAPWTADVPLPGGDMPVDGHAQLLRELASGCIWLPIDVAERYIRQYGTLVRDIIETAGAIADMGRSFGAGLYEREVRWLIGHEWARTAEDVLWRRTKLGLHFDAGQIAELEAFMAAAVAEADNGHVANPVRRGSAGTAAA
jgi:glycerol-3-phosphate dehydrogenase